MFSPPRPEATGSLATLIGLALVLPACAGESPPAAAAVAESAPAPTEARPMEVSPAHLIRPVTDLPFNELGEIMVLEYHRLGEPEGQFYRSMENFRGDLLRLYEAGYRPITVRQMITGDIDLPRGTTPVVFTIDDSSTGQFYLLEDGTIDPNSMVGIWEAFSDEYPGWDGGATWCVLPGADHPSNFFGEQPSRKVPRAEREERIQWKVDYLVANGHEICNHTLYHARLDRANSDAQVQEWIGRAADSLRVYLPEYEVVTFSLPLGMWPRNRALVRQGSHAGRDYHFDAVLEQTGGPSRSPFDRKFDPLSIPRVVVAPGAIPHHLNSYDQHPGRRYVSDGNPKTIAVPIDKSQDLAQEKWPDREVRVVEPGDRNDIGTARPGEADRNPRES